MRSARAYLPKPRKIMRGGSATRGLSPGSMYTRARESDMSQIPGSDPGCRECVTDDPQAGRLQRAWLEPQGLTPGVSKAGRSFHRGYSENMSLWLDAGPEVERKPMGEAATSSCHAPAGISA